MRSRASKDVLVVGAGPVGLTAALLMKHHGLDVQLVDEEWRTGAHSYALALHPASLELLDRIGLAAEVVRAGRRVDTVEYYDQERLVGELSFSGLEGKHPYGVVLQQDAFEDLLETALAARGVQVQWNQRLAGLQTEGAHVAVSLEQLEKESGGYAMAGTEWVVERTRELTARYVAGADGTRSTVRRLLDINPVEVGTPEAYAVFEFDCSAPPPGQVRVMLGPEPAVYWPMQRNRCRFSFKLPGMDLSSEVRTKKRLAVQFGRQVFPHLGEEALSRMLKSRAPWFTNTVQELHWSISVRFNRKLVPRFGQSRCWLLGDAAHQAGPIGVQSMNVGLLEAEDLAQRIAAGRDPSAPASLEAYGEHWLAQWRSLLGIQGGLGPSPSAPDWVKAHAALLPSTIPASGKDLVELGARLGLAPL